MEQPFSNRLLEIADSMGVALYQRFSLMEASLFLRCPIEEVNKLLKQRKIAFIQLPGEGVEFFGYQLLEYLLAQVKEISQPKTSGLEGERILRSKEVQELTGVSRTTLWRLEREGKFPARVSLCPGSIGWRSSEVDEWIRSR